MTIVADRLREAMAAKRLNQEELADEAGCSQGAISQILAGKTLRSRFMPAIARVLGVSVDWLNGDSNERGDGTTSGPTRDQLIEELDLVPIKSIDQAFGLGATFADDHIEVETRWFPRQWLRSVTSAAPANLTWAPGKGNSMEPAIRDGEPVLIDMTDNRVLDQDLIWAFTIGDTAMMKRLRIRGRNVTILSDNKDVSDDHADIDEINIVGRVTHVVRRI